MFSKQLVLLLFAFVPSTVADWDGAEIRSKNGYSAGGDCVKAKWRAKPAQGNCVITLFSLFNGDFHGSNVWSEVGIETFGGSATSNSKDFQTNYISQASRNADTKQHVSNHVNSQAQVNDIFNGGFHNFEIEFCPQRNGLHAKAVYKLDGFTLRTVTGGDLNNLDPPLEVYTAVWISKTTSQYKSWACTNSDSRPASAEAQVDYLQITHGQSTVTYNFNSESEVINNFDRSNWDFDAFDGQYDPDHVSVGSGRLKLKLDS